MKTKKSKLLSALLAAVMIASVGTVMVSADEPESPEYQSTESASEVYSYGDFCYVIDENDNLTIVGSTIEYDYANWKGNKFVIPAEIEGRKVVAVRPGYELGLGNNPFVNVRAVFLPPTVEYFDTTMLVYGQKGTAYDSRPWVEIFGEEGSYASTLSGFQAVPSMDWKTSGDYAYIVKDDGTLSIMDYTGTEEDVVIPESLDGMTVSEIGLGAFIGTEIKSVEMKSNITYISSYAFMDCYSLEKVRMTDSVYDIGVGTFYRDKNLSDINIPDNTTTSGFTFSGTKWLEDQKDEFVIVGDGMLVAYKGNDSVVTIPEGVKYTTSVFNYHNDGWNPVENVTKVILPKSLKEIWNCTFAECTNLKEVEIPEGVTVISSYSFEDCKSLEKVVIPASAETLDDNIFYGCDMEKLTVYGYDNTAAENYCKQNNIKFVSMGAVPKKGENNGNSENSQNSQNYQNNQNSTNNSSGTNKTTTTTSTTNTTTTTATNTTTTTATNTTTAADTSVPKTGDASASAIVFSVMLAASAAVIVFSKSRKKTH